MVKTLIHFTAFAIQNTLSLYDVRVNPVCHPTSGKRDLPQHHYMRGILLYVSKDDV
jgi:hypothetical protein